MQPRLQLDGDRNYQHLEPNCDHHPACTWTTTCWSQAIGGQLRHIENPENE